MFGIVEECAGFIDLDDLAGVHEHDAIRHLPRKAHFMGDADHGHALIGQQHHGIEHFLDHFGIERRGRFIEQHDLGRHAQGARDGDALLLTARKLDRVFVGLFGYLDAFEIGHGQLARLRRDSSS